MHSFPDLHEDDRYSDFTLDHAFCTVLLTAITYACEFPDHLLGSAWEWKIKRIKQTDGKFRFDRERARSCLSKSLSERFVLEAHGIAVEHISHLVPDWLDPASDSPTASHALAEPEVIFDVPARNITIRHNRFHFTTERQTEIANCIYDAGGNWITSNEIRKKQSERVDGIIGRMPFEIMPYIESGKGKGYRWRDTQSE